MIELNQRHDDKCMPFAGNLGRMVAGRQGHNIMQTPFFAFPRAGEPPLPLFNGMSAYLYYEIFSKAPSMAALTVPGSDCRQL